MTDMRLKTINKALATRFDELDNLVEAQRIFEAVLHACIKASDANLFVRLKRPDIENVLMSGGIPEGHDYRQISDEMDEKYFDAEDEGRTDDAFYYFTLARLMSALSFAAEATKVSDFSEATYEAMMSLPDPQTTADEIGVGI